MIPSALPTARGRTLDQQVPILMRHGCGEAIRNSRRPAAAIAPTMDTDRRSVRALVTQAIENPPEPPAIRFADARLAFAGAGQDVLALDSVSFDVPPRKITTVVGPSGCGKTTLLRLASGLLTASGGAVHFNGVAVNGLNTKVGYVTQDSNLFPWLTALGNVEFPLAVRGVPAAERREKARTGCVLSASKDSRTPTLRSSPAACKSASRSSAR